MQWTRNEAIATGRTRKETVNEAGDISSGRHWRGLVCGYSSDGTTGRLVQRACFWAAASVRERGPGVIQDVAYGIEKAGEASEAGAQKLRERAQAEDEQGEDSGAKGD